MRPSALLDPATLRRLERLVALARRVTARPRPARRRGRLGRGPDPGGRRDYAPGDDVRRVDWPAYARLSRLLVKEEEELPDARLEVVLDGSASMARGDPVPAERAALAVAAVAAVALARGTRVAVWWAGAAPGRLWLARPGELVRLVARLDGLAPSGRGALEATARRVPERPPGGAVLVTDGLDARDAVAAARRLRSPGRDVTAVLVAPASEVAPPQEQGALDAGRARLVDAETGEARELPWSALALEGAAAERTARLAAAHAALVAAGARVERLAAAEPFEAVALRLLRA